MSALPEIRDLLLRHAARLTPADLVLRRCDSPTEPMPSDTPLFALVAQGKKEATPGDRLFSYGAGEFVVTAAELPVVAHVSRATPAEPRLLDRPDDQRVLWAAAEREVLWWLLTGDQSGTARRSASGTATTPTCSPSRMWRGWPE